MMKSALTVLRGMHGECRAPLELYQRMDGSLGLFSKSEIRSRKCKTLLRLCKTSTLFQGQRNFRPDPLLARAVSAVAATSNFPTYFDITRYEAGDNETIDEEAERMNRASPLLREKKWMEAQAALFITACLVRVEYAKPATLGEFVNSSNEAGNDKNDEKQENNNNKPIVNLVSSCFESYREVPLLSDIVGSVNEVEARFRLFQSRALLEACLLDAITTADPHDAAALFGSSKIAEEVNEKAHEVTDIIGKAVEMVTSGAVFSAHRQDQDCNKARYLQNQHYYYAPYLSSLCPAADPHEANCRIVSTPTSLDLELLRPVRAGEELLKLEPVLPF